MRSSILAEKSAGFYGRYKRGIGIMKKVKKVIRKEIRNRTSPKSVKPRVFDASIDPEGGKVYLEVKGKNNQIERIDLDDVVAQINEATSEYSAK